jgi:biotin carboxyl carrier protein
MEHIGEGNLYSLLVDHRSHEAEVEAEADPGQRGRYHVLVSGTRFEVRVEDERARRLAPAQRKSEAGISETTVRAPIPGLVVKVLVTPGQAVVEGETLLILEAMKMENDLKAPHAGIVHEVRVQPGAQVALGETLASVKTTERA